MLTAGYFASADSINFYLKPIQWISSFKYSYQCLTITEFTDVQPLNCYNNNDNPNFNCDPLNGTLKFDESFDLSFILYWCVISGLILISLLTFLIKGRRT